MTKKIAISVPDDVADRLSAGDIENVSAYVTDAVRRVMRTEQTKRSLRAAGFVIADEGIERWRERLAKGPTPEAIAAARANIARLARGDT